MIIKTNKKTPEVRGFEGLKIDSGASVWDALWGLHPKFPGSMPGDSVFIIKETLIIKEKHEFYYW